MSEALDGIAIIGMAGRFPRARDLQELWRNLRDGVDCISDFADGELEVPVPPEVLRDPRFVKARGVLDGVDLFDAAFFDVPPRQAELMDPQHRLFLETAWQALEDAGYDPQRFPGSIGVFGGVTLSSYFLRHLQTNPDLLQALGSYQVALGTDRDYLTTLVSYKLGLRGPSLDVQTACSTSLVATVLACQSLLGYHCDMALAGGVSIKVPQKSGYLYQPGGLDSSDGRCRAFDARADGSVYGSGVGVAVLKRLEDALADGDAIHAVILGGAINNDGAARVGFTAPGVEGQAEVIANAQALAGVDPETIGYVECHGTGTALGDPIEVAALTRAFRSGGAKQRGFCAIGSVKTNIGHCSAAAGIAGLLKATLALGNRQIPPSLHFEQPNPAIDFAASPFRVSERLTDWEADGHPRRAGVSSFGLGGTNAHVVLEEAPELEASGPSRPWQLVVLSARSEAALESATDALATDLAAHPDWPLADVAFTAQVGRRAFPHRRVLVCRDMEDARQALTGRDPRRLLDAVREPGKRPVAFLFPGVGDHYPGMARGLYDTEPVFREHLDRCCDLMSPRLGGDLREAIFEGGREAAGAGPDLKRLLGREPRGQGKLSRTLWAQPAVFAVEMALARLWMEWGVKPDALLGYSLGEYTAACLAGVLPLEDAALLVAERARLLEGLPAGAMLAVPLPEEELAPRLAAAGLDLAAVNTPGVCVAAGPEEAVQELGDELAAEGVPCRLLPVGHAFHSRWMEPVAPALTRLARGLRLSPPKIPYVSNVTGTWITPAEATDPESWARHLCRPVRFAAGLATLWQDPARVLLEVGPGFGLSTLALQTADGECLALPSLPNEHDPQPDPAFLLTALGKLWLAGVEVDWPGFWKGERRRRVRLPGYPFERQRFWVEVGVPPRQETAQEEAARLRARLRELEGLGAVVGEAGSDRSVGSVGSVGSSAPLAARHARPRLRNAWVAPRTAAESWLAGVFETLLGIQGVGAHDSFFELGGHSLLATQVLARLRDRFGAELQLAAFFAEPTVAGLAGHVEAAGLARESGPPLVAAEWQPGEPVPLSFAQERLWFLDRLDGASPVYNLPGGLRLAGRLDVAALAGALSEITRRHAALRTAFAEREGRPVQVIAPPAPSPLPLVDLSGLAAAEPEVRRLAIEEALRPFDLQRGPVLRATLLRLAETEHAVLFTLHHIAGDAWSIGVLTQEVAALYRAFAAGRPSPLPELPVQYADYARWQRAWLQGEALEKRLAFWRETLAGIATLQLPADRPRPPVQTFRGAAHALTLAPVEPPAGTTLFMALLAGLTALLHRWADQDDVAVGSPVAGRPRVQLEPLIGFFVNTLVLRTDCGGDPSFATLLSRVRETAVAALSHQEIPFEKVVEELQPERDLSRTPLFQVLFTVQNTPAGALDLPGLTLSPLSTGGGPAARFDLTVAVAEAPDGLFARFDYNVDLFEAATIARFADQWAHALSGTAAEPGLRLSEIPLLSAAEAAQVLREWSGGAPLGASTSVWGLFVAQAARTPEAVALVFEGETWSYGELLAWSNQLAHRLRGLGVGPEVRVGLALERSPEVIAAMLAVLAAGGAYVPLDPSYPAERLAFMVSDSRPRVLLTGRAAPELDREPLTVERPADFVDPGPPETLPGSGPDSPVYVIYTSGSTGTPKGVTVCDRGLANFSLAMVATLGLGPGERFLQFASLSFDASAVQIFPTLLSGAALVLHPDPARLSVTELLHLCERRSVTVLDLPAALWRQWVDEMSERARHGERLPGGLHTFLTGGESLSRGTLERWASLLDRPARFFSSYGPTEATITAALFSLAGEEIAGFLAAGPGIGSPIGRPLPGVRAMLLDRRLRPVPVGVPGELAIGGAGLARGYLDRPDLTAERFVPDPLAEEPGARIYRTGDRARWRADGSLEFLGRADDQVKIRGFRVELGEVEAALARHPAVRGAAVTVWGETDRRLAAYGVLSESGAATGSELRSWLRERLPEALVPSAVVLLDAFPTTPGGKVDRRALPRPEAMGEEDEAGGAPRHPLEETLAVVWARLLGVERVGIHRSFFDLGGHSLLATQLVSRVREVLGVEVPLRDLFEAPTVAGFTRRVEAALRERAGAGVPPLVPVPRDGELPLSFAQERLWFIDQLQPGNAVYNMPSAVRLSGPLAPAALAGALTALVARHEVLRTSFPVTAGRPRQEIAPPSPFPLPVVDLSALPDPRQAAVRLAAAEARRPFDLARGPLLRAGLARLGADDHLLLATMHHSVSDGWSMGIFVRELSALYGSALHQGLADEGAPPELPPLPVQYADFAAWQRSWLTGEVLETQLAWWCRELGGELPVLELPADRPRPAMAAFRGGRRSVHVPGGVAARLAALARSEEATLFMVLLAAFQTLLHRLSGQDDLTVGSPIAGRTRSELEGLIGFFVNTLVLRAGLGGDPAFRALIGQARATALGAYAHQDLPFEKLVEEVAPRRSLAHAPLFQAMFGLQNLPGGTVEMAQGLTLRPLEGAGTGTTRFDLTLLLGETPQGLSGHLEYDAGLFDAVTLQRWMACWQVLLAGIAADPEARLSELPLLSEAERSQLAVEWNGTGESLIAEGGPATLHGLFLAQARVQPDAVAVIAPDRELTYAELAREAEGLAALLTRQGLEPGGRVAVLLERSADAVVGLLAILVAGGTYVPLDPANPAERLVFQISDAGAALLVTRAGLIAGLDLPAGVGTVLVEPGLACLPSPGEGEGGAGRGAGGEGLAYVIYTSGSTGMPKGVMIEHRQAVNTLLDVNRRFAVGPCDRVFAISALSFDLSVWDLFGTFAAGAAAVLPPPAPQPDPAAWAESLARGGVTVWSSAPALLELLADSGAPLPSTLRLVMLSGDWIPLSLPDRVRRRVPGARVVSLGGATEGSIWSILHPVGTLEPGWRSIPYGRPMAAQRFHALDRRGRLVPIGVAGELCIGGAGVAVGYLGRPDLTAERFVPDPFGAAGVRLYRTGDLGRHRADGTLEILGRLDQQVKIRGFRIELGEIETVLARCPGVREAVAAARGEGGAERRLVVYAVPEAGQALDPAALRAWLAARLPEAMVPLHVVLLERLPLTANGKVDRRALPAPEAPVREVVAPRDAVEARIAGLWRRFLNVPEVSVHDNFFALGGHSLLATRLVAALREEMGVEVPVRDVFEHPVLADLALAIAGRQAERLDEAELSRMFQDLEGLSDEEVERLLAGEATAGERMNEGQDR
jgi:amino acid adenylation domain-containing protein